MKHVTYCCRIWARGSQGRSNTGRTQGGRVGWSQSTGTPGYSCAQKYLEDTLTEEEDGVSKNSPWFKAGGEGSCATHSARSRFPSILEDSRTLR